MATGGTVANRTLQVLRDPPFGLLAALLGYTLLWWALPQPFIASDPWEYARRGFDLWQHGDLGEGGIFDQRLTLIGGTALAYSLFGVSAHTTHLPALLAALLLMIVVWAALPPGRARLLGLGLTFTSLTLLKHAITLYPDLPGAALMAACYLMLTLRSRTIHETLARWTLPWATPLLFFAAMLAKETAVWLLPIWGVMLLSDARSAEGRALLPRFHLPALVIGLALGAAYLLFCQATWGHALARLQAIHAMHGEHLWSLQQEPAALRHRLTSGAARLLLGQYGAPLWALALVGAWTAIPRIRPWTWYGLAMLLFYWCGPTGLRGYEPLPLMERMTLPLLPPLLILAAQAAAQITLEGTALPRRAAHGAISLFLLAVFAVPFFHRVQELRRAPLHEEAVMEGLRELLSEEPGRPITLVCAEERSLAALPYHFGFSPPDELQPVGLQDVDTLWSEEQRVLLFVHRERAAYLHTQYGLPDATAAVERMGLKPLVESGPVALYEVDGRSRQEDLIRLARSFRSALQAGD